MWILFIITILALPDGKTVEKGTPLAGFQSYAECKVEEDRIQDLMYQSYPKEKDTFYLKCLIRAKETT